MILAEHSTFYLLLDFTVLVDRNKLVREVVLHGPESSRRKDDTQYAHKSMFWVVMFPDILLRIRPSG